MPGRRHHPFRRSLQFLHLVHHDPPVSALHTAVSFISPVHVNVLVGPEFLAAQSARLEKAGVLEIGAAVPGWSSRARLGEVEARGRFGLDDYVGLGRLGDLRQDPQADGYRC